MKTPIFFLLLSFCSLAFAKDYEDIPLEKLMSEPQQQQIGIQKLTPEERERLRVFLIETFLLGVEAGKKENTKTTRSTPSKPSAPSVIESQIDGDFEGWEGQTIIKLINGQIWQQTEYFYHYHYAFMPKVLIFNVGGTYKMKVDGVDKAISVTQLK
jgi:hypothetical protein